MAEKYGGMEFKLKKKRYSLNVSIYDHAWTHKRELISMIKDYSRNNSVKLKSVMSIACSKAISDLPVEKNRLYFINVDDLEKKIDAVQFALFIRDRDLGGTIVILTEHDIFSARCYKLALDLCRRHVMVMSILTIKAGQYKNEIQACIAAHISKTKKSHA